VDPSVIYATIELAQRTGGLWRSIDAGESWEKRSDEVYSGTGPHYYQEIFASPHDVDTLYQVAPTLYRTVDGGKTMQAVKMTRYTVIIMPSCSTRPTRTT